MAKTLIGNIKGPKGDRGADGAQGAQGPTGATGATGPQGLDGDSAYQIAVNNGFEGSEEDWLASLEGGTFVGTITGTIATATDSTHAPIISIKSNGYTTQDGTPTPDNPIEINGLAKDGAIEVKTCRKNVLNRDAIKTGMLNGITYTLNEDGSVIVNGTATANTFINYGYVDVPANTEYILSGCPSGGGDSTYKLATYKNSYAYSTLNNDFGSGKTFTLAENTRCFVSIAIYKDTTVSNLKFYPMIRPSEIADDTYEPYTETTATIPTDAPLYEGDYLEVYADGSGEEYRNMTHISVAKSDFVKITGTDNTYYQTSAKYPKDAYGTQDNKTGLMYCNLTSDMINPDNPGGGRAWIGTKSDYNGALARISTDVYEALPDTQNVEFVYKLATPTETPLTAEQVAQFKKLYTFEPVTNVLCDGEVEMIYLKNTNGGKALASVRRGVEHADTATTATTATKATQDGNGNVIAETYYRKANFDKIVGGTVEPSGKTNVQYSVPTDVSSKGVVVQTNTSGTLINALSEATASISGFFSILYNAVKTRYLGRIDLGMSATQNTYDFTSFAGYDRYTFVFKGQDANRSLFTRELLTIHNIEKNTSNVGKVCLNISNNYTFEPWVEMYPSGNKTYIVVGITDTTGLTTLVSGLFVEVYGAMD